MLATPPIPRVAHRARIASLLREFPVVTLVGPRQVGKTTLACQVAKAWRGRSTFFDLESPKDVARLSDTSVLSALSGLVVLDEIERRPDIFPLLRVLADRAGRPATFLLLGSASPALWRGASESLAGRVAFHVVDGFGLDEVGKDRIERLWLRGGFPRSYLARTEASSLEWRLQLVETLVGRDLPALGFSLPAESLRRLWTMLAHGHGQVLNLHALGRSLGVDHTTVRRWIDAFVGTYAVRLLRPFSENLKKRLVKTPKLYVSDPGMLHALLDIPSMHALLGHPIVGASWESFAAQLVVRRLGARPDQCWFYGTHAGAEIDLLVTHGRRRYGFEIKRTSAPAVSKSIRVVLDDLHLDRVDVVHAGDETYPLTDRVRALAASRILADLEPL